MSHSMCIETNTKPKPTLTVSKKDNGVLIQLNKKQFICSNTDTFIEQYITQNPLKNNDQLINFITAHSHINTVCSNQHLFITWRINIIDANVVVRVPLDLFTPNLEQLDEKEQLEYYKEQYHQMKRLSVLNNWILDVIKIDKFDNNCIFKIYSVQDFANIDESKTMTKQSLLGDIFKDFGCANAVSTVDQKYIPFCIMKGKYYFQTKPRSVSITIHEDKAQIKLYLAFNDKQIGWIQDSQEFVDIFTKDIVLKLDTKYTPNTYESGPIRINFNLTRGVIQTKTNRYQQPVVGPHPWSWGAHQNNQNITVSQSLRFSVYYQLIYKKNLLALKYITSGYKINEQEVETRTLTANDNHSFMSSICVSSPNISNSITINDCSFGGNSLQIYHNELDLELKKSK